METTDIAVETVEETAAEKNDGRAVPESQIDAEGQRDLTAEFEELIRGEYKDVFAARVKSILVRRFRERAKDAETIPDEKSEGKAEFATSPDQSEIEALRRDYPEFELERERADPNFARLLALGTDLRTAYEFTHRDTLMPRALNAALEAELSRTAVGSGSAAERISERSRNAGSVGLSVDTASRSAREALERRALRGEKIIL